MGAGLIGRRHIELIGRDPQAVLTAVVDPAPAAADVAGAAGVPLCATLAEALDAQDPAGVVVATPNHLHSNTASSAWPPASPS